MTFLPIVGRELRVAARRRGTYWARAGVALVCGAIGGFLLMDQYGVPANALGKRIFVGLVGVAMVHCLLAGRRSTADSLSEEKREGTLGLLFLTDLKGYDVVFGKIAATSLNSFYGLLAVLPVMAIPLLLGGVSSGEFWRTVLVLIDTFLFSLAIGIAASAATRDARKAMGLNLLLVFGVAAFPAAICGLVVLLLDSASAFFAPLMFSCPVFALFMSDDPSYNRRKWWFWATVTCIHLLTWLFIWLASVTVPRSWQDKPEKAHLSSGKQRTWRQKWQEFKYGNLEQRLRLRHHLLPQGAYFWLTSRFRFSHLQVWFFLVWVAGWWVWVWTQTRSAGLGGLVNGINLGTAIVVNSALKIWVSIESARQLSEDRKTGAFELLLGTPLGPETILGGVWRSLLRQFLLPIVFVLGAEVLFMVADTHRMVPYQPVGDSGLPRWLWGVGLFIFVADLFSLGWVSMWAAVRSRGINQATASSLVRILVIPWLLMWIVSVIDESGSGAPFVVRRQPQWPFYLEWYFFLSIGADILFGLIAYTELQSKFRLLATTPKSTLRGLFGRRRVRKDAAG